ncbi:hypothetical protein ACFLXT_01135, partial [Chloroflexota bacterium]
LTPWYWIGLGLLVLDSILAFLDRELKKDAVFLLLLITLGLFLYGIVIFAYANTRIPDSYMTTGQVQLLLAARHIDIGNPPHLGSYFSWPAFHFINASILTTTGAGFGFIKYMPLFWMLLITFITYGIGKRLELAPNRCFLLSFLVLSSWISLTDYHPHSLGVYLFLLLFMLLLAPRRTVADSVVTILIFTTLVLSHGFASFAVLTGLLGLAIYRKETRFIALFAVIFGAWWTYQAAWAMEAGVRSWLLNPLVTIFREVEIAKTAWPSATARAINRYSQLGLLASYTVLVFASFILLLRRKIAQKHRKWVISSICWSIGVALLIFSGYGLELDRMWAFSILPAVSIIVLSFPIRKIATVVLIAMMFLSPTLRLPAHYGAEAAWAQVLTTELKGVEFLAPLAHKVQPGEYIFNQYVSGYSLLLFYYPEVWTVPELNPGSQGSPPWPEVDFSMLDKVRYVTLSKQGEMGQVYAYGEDRYAAWPQTEAGKRANLLYNNGSYQIYENHLAE